MDPTGTVNVLTVKGRINPIIPMRKRGWLHPLKYKEGLEAYQMLSSEIETFSNFDERCR